MTSLPRKHSARRARAGGRLAVAALALGALACGPAPAQEFPAKTITFVVPFAAGSGTDQLARATAAAITNATRISVLVDNKAGANGFIAAQAVARAAPDGYTILMTTNTTHAANEHLYRKLPYDPVKDFTPVMLLSKGSMVLLVNPASPVKSLGDLLALARRTPGKLNFGSGSSSSRVAGELLRQTTGIAVTHVPYKSNPFAITDLLGGQIDYMFADAATALPQVNAGKLRGLASSGLERLVTAPELKALQAVTGNQVSTSSPQELARVQAAESQKWGRVIRAAGITPE